MTISRKEIYAAKTYAELVALAARHGRTDVSAYAWAKRIIEARARK